MKISLIVAMAANRVIGLDNKMPWHLSADLKKFKAITMGSPIVMGRKTYESIGKPLPGRSNIIISRNLDYQQTDCLVFNDIKTAIEASSKDAEEIFIIGGAELYKATLPHADNLYLTLINQDFDGDTFFPEIDFKVWTEASREDISDDPSVNFNYSFLKLSRTN